MFRRFLKKLAQVVMAIGFRYRVENPIPDVMGRALICANHASNWDPIALLAAVPENAIFVAKKELEHVFVVGWILRKMQVIFVDRDHNDLTALRKMLHVLQDDCPLVLFPEGTRVHEPAPEKMKDGTGFFVQKAKTDVHCAYLDTTYRFRAPFTVRFRPALKAEMLSTFEKRKGRHQITKLVYQMIYEPERLVLESHSDAERGVDASVPEKERE